MTGGVLFISLLASTGTCYISSQTGIRFFPFFASLFGWCVEAVEARGLAGVLSSGVHAPQREQGFACYWMEGNVVGL